AGLGLLLGTVGVVVSIVRKGSGIGFPIAGAAVNGVALVMAGFSLLLAAGVSSSVDKATKVNQVAENRKEQPLQISEPLKAEPPKENDPLINKKEAAKEAKQDDPPIAKEQEDKEPKKNGPPVTTKQADKEPEKKAPPEISSEQEWPDASKSAVRHGDIRMKVTSVKVGIVDLADSIDKRAGRSKNEHLQVYLTVENMSETKLIRFRGWSGRDVTKQPTLQDNFGNSYRTIGFGIFSRPVGQVFGEKAIYPGKTENDVIIFDPPVKGAKFLRLTLPANSFGGDGQLQIQVPASMVSSEEPASTKIGIQELPEKKKSPLESDEGKGSKDGEKTDGKADVFTLKSSRGFIDMSILSADIRRVNTNRFGQKLISDNPFLVLRITVDNRHPSKRFGFDGWQYHQSGVS